jgi:hypothetical protein
MRGLMRELGLGLIIAWLASSQALGAESAADAIKAFGLIGTWSVDCTRDVRAACDRSTGCGARSTYEVSPSGQPVIKTMIGTLVAGQPRTVEITIEQATRIADDKIAITSIQGTQSAAKLAWYQAARRNLASRPGEGGRQVPDLSGSARGRKEDFGGRWL